MNASQRLRRSCCTDWFGWVGVLLRSIDFYQMLLLVKFSLVMGTIQQVINDGAPGDTQPRRWLVWLDPLLHKGGFVQAHRSTVFSLLWAELEAGFGLCLHAESGRLH